MKRRKADQREFLAMGNSEQHSRVHSKYCLENSNVLTVYEQEAVDTKAQYHGLTRTVSSACCESMAAGSDRARLH